MSIKTINDFMEVFNAEYANSFMLVGKLENIDECVTVIHKICNTKIIFYPKYIKYLHCTKCFHYGRQITDTKFKKRVVNRWNGRYVVLSSYLRWNVPVKVHCSKCGFNFPSIPNNLLRGSGCPECKRKRLSILHTTTYDEAEHLVESVSHKEYKIIKDSYNGTNSIAMFHHNVCNRDFPTKPNNFICNGSRCPLCYLDNKQSKGEKYIQTYLDKRGYSYEYPKTFNSLRDIYPLHYDFYLPAKNILIEYQGEQHYYPVNIFGGSDQFKTQQQHDHMKCDYARSNGFNLLLIPFMVDTYQKVCDFIDSYIHVMYDLN